MPARPRKTAAPAEKSFADRLAGIRLPERVVPLCLRLDLVADHQEADELLQQLMNRPAQKLGGDGRAEIRQRILELEAEMKAYEQPFRLRGMPGPQWRKLKREHQPRPAEDGDGINPADRLGINNETFWEPAVRASIVDPEISDEQWQVLYGSLPDKQFDRLATAAWNLNESAVNIPFSFAASLMTPDSDSE